MTRRGPTVIQRVWCSRSRAYKHRIVRQFVRTRRLGRKPKLTEAEQLFARA